MEFEDETGELRYRTELMVMGLSATVQSDYIEVIDAVHRRFRSAAGAATTTPLRIDVMAMVATEEPGTIAAPLIWHRHGATAVAAYGVNLLTAQHDRGYGLAFVTPTLITSGDRLVADVIEPLALELARGQGRVPIRATALGNGATVAIVLGTPDLDLSALILSCSDAGLTVFADQTLYLSRSEGLRLWGARAVDGLGATEISGRPLVCVVAQAAGRASRLERSEGVMLRPFLQAAGADATTAQLLAQNGAYRLLMGSDPRNAAALLAHLVAEAC